jgi:hypothetical protein
LKAKSRDDSTFIPAVIPTVVATIIGLVILLTSKTVVVPSRTSVRAPKGSG